MAEKRSFFKQCSRVFCVLQRLIKNLPADKQEGMMQKMCNLLKKAYKTLWVLVWGVL